MLKSKDAISNQDSYVFSLYSFTAISDFPKVVIDMNETMWNSTEETLFSHQSFVNLLLGGVTLFVHGYAIFISSAIYDYQGTIHKQLYHTLYQLKDFCDLFRPL